MTGRRRGGGSSGSSGSHTPSRRPGGTGDGSDPSRTGTPGDRTGGTGGPGVGANVDAIDTMAGRLDATRTRIDGVGNTVRGVNVGQQSMGVIGSGFTGAAQSHLRTAEQHVTRTTDALDRAQRGTRGTAQAYRDTDATNAANLSRPDTTGRPPTTTPQSSTTTATSTDPGRTATTPPATGTDGPPPGGRTGGTPPGGPPPGTPGGPPGGPGRGGTPPGGPAARREHWMQAIERTFTKEEFHKFKKALGKMAENPNEPGRVAGSGALTPKERELVARAQHLVTIDPDTPMVKIVPNSDVPKILSGQYDSVGGFVSRAQDGTHLRTTDDLVQGNRLDYRNSPFGPGMSEVHVIEFPATDPGKYQVPLGAPQDVETSLPENSPAVRRATDDMIDAARAAGLNPGSFERYIQDWPYSGIGVTADGEIGIPERRMPERMPYPDGSVMSRYDASGNKVPVARYDISLGKWVSI
jgi:uncharacterized protein YukE